MADVISSNANFTLGPRAIVPDDISRIRRQVIQWASGTDADRVDWILVTGGTGWSQTDVTPQVRNLLNMINWHVLTAVLCQALNPLLEPLPTLAHYLSSFFLNKTPMSILSRPVVGILDRTLVIGCSGSKKACAETWEALTSESMTKALSHGFQLLRGGSGQDVHPPREKIKMSGGCGHHDHGKHGGRDSGKHHAHGGPLSKDPSASVAARLRQSPFPLISLSEALELVTSVTPCLPVTTVSLSHNLRDCVLAEDVLAQHDLPSTLTTNVDGYAVKIPSDTELSAGTFQVVKADTKMQADAQSICVRVNTGGPLPAGYNAVVMVEDTQVLKGAICLLYEYTR